MNDYDRGYRDGYAAGQAELRGPSPEHEEVI
jgi:hypothetical protein